MLISEIPLKKQVKFGDFYHSPREIDLICAKSVRKLLSKQIGDDRFFGDCGSTTLVKVKSDYFALFTGHQIGNPNYLEIKPEFSENYIIPSLSPQLRNLSTSKLVYSTGKRGDEFEDIVGFKIFTEDKEFKKEKAYFCKVVKPNRTQMRQHFYVGYPRLDNLIRYDEMGVLQEIKQNGVVNDCKLDGEFASPTPYFRKFFHELNNRPADGLSGGAIFVLTDDGCNNYEVFLDSIIVRGNNEFLYGISAEYIHDFGAPNL